MLYRLCSWVSGTPIIHVGLERLRDNQHLGMIAVPIFAQYGLSFSAATKTADGQAFQQ